MKDINFGKIKVGDNKPTVIIAEVASQHMGSMDKAKKLIDAAKYAGADIVKFQLHISEAEMIPNTIRFWGGSLDEVLNKVKMRTKEEHKELMEYCKSLDIEYLCTPFCIEASDVLEEINVNAFKIGSGELTNIPMIRHIAKKGKPVIVSTGMCVMKEIKEAVSIFKEENVEFILMNCTSEYPARYENLNLNFIKKLRDEFNVFIGHSDHTNEIYSAIAAVCIGANIIEKHFTIRDFKGPDDLVSLDPEEFKQMVSIIRKIEKALVYQEKKITKDEIIVRDWAHHSVVLSKNIKKNELITKENTRVARPGRGIPAKFIDKNYSHLLFGQKVKFDLSKNTILKWEHLNEK